MTADILDLFEPRPPTVEAQVRQAIPFLFEPEPADQVDQRFTPYRPDPDDPPGHCPTAAYIEAELGWTPWGGSPGKPGQVEIIAAYELAIRQQLEKYQFEQGERSPEACRHWKPGQTIQNWIRLQSGNLVGKTKIAAGLFSHFFDCFPAIITTYAPTADQVNDLLWKEIRTDRQERDLPGRVLEIPRLKLSANRFAAGKATADIKGRGVERIHGQHTTHLMFILDEAEGIPDFVYDGLEGMDTGVVVIVLVLGNPRTRTSRFHKIRGLPYVKSFRLNTLDHPNVVNGNQAIPGAATRDWLERRLESSEYATVVAEHDEKAMTFEVDWLSGKIYRPNAKCFWRILGLAPADLAGNVFFSVGSFEAACQRQPGGRATHRARLGLDCARFGTDAGTLYCNHAGEVRLVREFWQQDSNEYYYAIRDEAKRLAAAGVTDLHIRIDDGGGYGSGPIDRLKIDEDLKALFEVYRVHEVLFNGSPYDPEAYKDSATEMYAEAAGVLQQLSITAAHDTLEADLCERHFKYVVAKGFDVKRLESKDDFRARHNGRSPDHGDGLVLAAAPDFCFFGSGGIEVR